MAYFVPAAEHLRNDTGLPISSARPADRSPTHGRHRRSRPPQALRRRPSRRRALVRRSRQGEVYALLGENGAGKSTTVEILEGHRTRDVGDRLGAGRRSRRRRARLPRPDRHRAAVLGRRDRVHRARGDRALRRCYRNPRPLDEVVELVGLDEKVDARVGSLSGGQRRRVDLALGIVGRPELLFLDEPTTGFDPSARRRSWDLIEALGDDGTTVLLTTHYLDEAEHLADRVGVLSQGRLIAEGTPGTADRPGQRHRRELHAARRRPPRRARSRRSASLLGVEHPGVGPAGRGEHRAADRRGAPDHGMGGRDRRRARVAVGERVSLEDVYLSLTDGADAVEPVEETGRERLPVDPGAARCPDPVPARHVLADPGGGVLHARVAADHARAVQRAVRQTAPSTTAEGEISAQQFYTGGLAAFTAVSATFTNLANMVPIRRDEGVLKRWRGTPLPTWIYLAGFIVSAVLIALVGVVLMLTLGVVVYDLEIEPAKMPAPIVTFVVGVGAFAALGMAVAALVEVGEFGLGGGERDHPADGVRVERVHPGRRRTAMDRGDRQLLPAEAVRRGVPGLFHAVRRSRRRSTGRASPTSRCGASLGLVVALRAVHVGAERERPRGAAPAAPPPPPPTDRTSRKMRQRCAQRTSARISGGCQEKTTVLRPWTRTRCSRWARTARASTIVSRSRPREVRRSTSSRWVTWAVSCSMIGPSSRSAVA